MFEPRVYSSPARQAFALLRRMFDTGVRTIRKTHGNAIFGLLQNVMQLLIMVLVLYIMFWLFGMRHSPIRGDFILYLMSGVFVFMAQMRALSAVMGSDGPASAMMLHAPMNMLVAVGGAALSALYLQVISVGVILYAYHVLFAPISIEFPIGLMGVMLLAWFSGVGLGMVFQAAMPWWPEGVKIISMLYRRLSMVFSGKMFVANMMPGYLLPYFDWNPLFHMVDQSRGYMFLNYEPRFTDIYYAMHLSIVFFIVGIIAEHYTGKYASPSWSAGR